MCRALLIAMALAAAVGATAQAGRAAAFVSYAEDPVAAGAERVMREPDRELALGSGPNQATGDVLGLGYEQVIRIEGPDVVIAEPAEPAERGGAVLRRFDAGLAAAWPMVWVGGTLRSAFPGGDTLTDVVGHAASRVAVLGGAIYVSRLLMHDGPPRAGGSVVSKYSADGAVLTERVFEAPLAVTALDASQHGGREYLAIGFNLGEALVARADEAGLPDFRRDREEWSDRAADPERDQVTVLRLWTDATGRLTLVAGRFTYGGPAIVATDLHAESDDVHAATELWWNTWRDDLAFGAGWLFPAAIDIGALGAERRHTVAISWPTIGRVALIDAQTGVEWKTLDDPGAAVAVRFVDGRDAVGHLLIVRGSEPGSEPFVVGTMDEQGEWAAEHSGHGLAALHDLLDALRRSSMHPTVGSARNHAVGDVLGRGYEQVVRIEGTRVVIAEPVTRGGAVLREFEAGLDRTWPTRDAGDGTRRPVFTGQESLADVVHHDASRIAVHDDRVYVSRLLVDAKTGRADGSKVEVYSVDGELLDERSFPDEIAVSALDVHEHDGQPYLAIGLSQHGVRVARADERGLPDFRAVHEDWTGRQIWYSAPRRDQVTVVELVTDADGRLLLIAGTITYDNPAVVATDLRVDEPGVWTTRFLWKNNDRGVFDYDLNWQFPDLIDVGALGSGGRQLVAIAWPWLGRVSFLDLATGADWTWVDGPAGAHAVRFFTGADGTGYVAIARDGAHQTESYVIATANERNEWATVREGAKDDLPQAMAELTAP